MRASVAALVVTAVLVGVPFLGGCSAQKKVGGWFGGEEGPKDEAGQPDSAAGQPYYAAAGGLTVYSEPTSSSKVVGKLSPHERVMRHKVTRGYAHVKADASGLEGWVNNGMLLWRLPAATPSGPSGAEPATPAAEAVNAAPPEAAEPPAAPESPEPAPPPAEKPPQPRRTGPSIFDPY